MRLCLLLAVLILPWLIGTAEAGGRGPKGEHFWQQRDRLMRQTKPASDGRVLHSTPNMVQRSV